MADKKEKKQEETKQNVAKREPTMAERFTGKVLAEFCANTGEIALTNFQKRLAQNYFMALDAALLKAEQKRLKKTTYQDKVPVTWANVNMDQLSRDVVSAARIGLDPAQSNHINVIPYKNNATGKYDIGFIEGYRGKELKAMKYGLDIPDSVIVEVVHVNDKFKSHKKDQNHDSETYEFEIVNDFDRGDVVGGFYYHVYSAAPEKNKLVVMTIKDIEKRKPRYASAEFWGGEKDKWENGQKVGKETVEGWFEQMVYKTIYRAAYGAITIDSQKIDDDFLRLKQLEDTLADAEVAAEIAENANGEFLDIESEEEDVPAGVDPETGEEPEAATAKPGF